jgi:hypothetical protein
MGFALEYSWSAPAETVISHDEERKNNDFSSPPRLFAVCPLPGFPESQAFSPALDRRLFQPFRRPRLLQSPAKEICRPPLKESLRGGMNRSFPFCIHCHV